MKLLILCSLFPSLSLLFNVDKVFLHIEFITLDDIYKEFCREYGLNIKTIRNNVNNAITKRNIKKSKDNFKTIFGYEYDPYVFVPKYFIEEVARVIRS